ncbi:ThiF family adenylyltransferase [Microbacterium sp. NPDC076911]|uniref:ThiF family adenylyltransferase n=1 Tax=Microbacterium sp. NPDC076911 TaxID=3154958 RepID=UPI003422AE1B
MPLPPLVDPLDMLDADEAARTARHAILAGFGDVAQRRLAAAHVAVIGAGGIGSPVVLALAAAGVGELTIIDDDDVEVSNLQRQIMHRRSDVGHPKVDSARRVAQDLSQSVVHTVRERVTAANASAMLAGAHVVIDGTDTFETREVVAAACESLGTPLVWGVVQEFHAQATVFWSSPPPGTPAVLLRDLYPPESVGTVPSCSEVGVLGSLCMQVGALLATEAIKLITGTGEPLLGRVVIIDALRGRSDEVPLRPSTAAANRHTPPLPLVAQLTPVEALTAQQAGATIIDVREPSETSAGIIAGATRIPLQQLLQNPSLAGTGAVVIVCKGGMRAERAAHALIAAGHSASVLEGGMDAWSVAQREVVPA